MADTQITPGTGELQFVLHLTNLAKRVLETGDRIGLDGQPESIARTPATGTVTLTGEASTLEATGHVIVTPGVGAVVQTGVAPCADLVLNGATFCVVAVVSCRCVSRPCRLQVHEKKEGHG